MSDNDQPIVEMRGIGKRFGRIQALNDVDLDIRDGEIMGLVGDNGAGKSTLVKTLVGIHQPDEGEIRINGEQVTIDSPKEAQAHGIATVYQDLALVDQQTVDANIFLGRTKTRKLGGLIPVIDWKGMREEAATTLQDRLNFDVPIDSKVEFLSGGERQAVAIGRALITDPDLIILDEPTSALSADAAERVIDLVKTLRDEGISVLLISHSFEEIFSLTDRMTILHNGERVGTVDSADVTEDEVVEMMVAGNEIDEVRAATNDTATSAD
ncbi:ABC-transport system ATP binding protein [Halosimplex carlsbadense 2-9-1]|uniref:ABC-transport system ATP binding protein n=1 Tax=Halosimplex carlsbadense 2-9-1 TaxID=797114 RepID=M0D096_9EURY|nr:ATP-binding cassette domain-containing protein [Halosimplex carlsbadense]ELZ27544.1 ABC-transport system ATP binding protein [Halosimplex carlsbadense 2-9-1]